MSGGNKNLEEKISELKSHLRESKEIAEYYRKVSEDSGKIFHVIITLF